MVARRLGFSGLSGRDLRAAAIGSAATLLLTLLAIHKMGSKGLLVPLLLAVALVLLARPLVAVSVTLLVTVVAEGPTFGLFHFTDHVYSHAYKNLAPLDFLVIVTLASVAIDLVRRRRQLYVPRPLLLPLAFLALAMVQGAVVGHSNGAGIRTVVLSENVLAYLLLVPVAVANLDLPRPVLVRVVQATIGLAVIKAILGVAEIASGQGQSIEGNSRLTYYEPAANWLIMVAILAVFAAILARAKLPRWMLAGELLLLASLLLSYRRSFWIGLALGLLLVLLLGSRPLGRRLLVPAALMVVFAVWLLSALHFQAQSPVTRRVSSLNPQKLQSNLEDRYRLDERANVLGEIRSQPIAGLGMTIPWQATVRPLPVEHQDGRQYVHFAALWFWLKLGILGLVAYVGTLAGGLVLAFRAWRRSREPLLRAFGLGSLCAIVGLAVIDTTASFTGVDLRFTVLFGAQLGLLALIARAPGRERSA